ncbi:hypothetical protein CEUSTIGMA_g907.t1 [Chlamydomonas eustigma]|uniref:Exocyst subunit Exo70 family protein n=1 Tax=Chlamydomonas eustigma TaxID=1157962 RepID=A0A250WRI7_9CHLO|nr:hypothetical protein CEUSTIGMA_g907.t1 [Chlamydomonas eustigma]|eukprot:GAX73455.1 hypothetical protein CEUSTIGMA_g907.t1 [Chlamydomonas eustigma]
MTTPISSDPLRDGLLAYNHLSIGSSNLLSGLQQQLDLLVVATTPISTRALALMSAEENICLTKAYIDELLGHLETSHKVESFLKSGPGRDIDTYLRHLEALEAALKYLETHSDLLSAQEAYGHAELVHGKAMKDCEADFGSTLGQQGSATMPSAALLTKQATENLQVAAVQAQLEVISGPPLDRLQRLAAAMMNSQHMTCVDVYKQVRGRTVESIMRLVGYEPNSTLSSLQVQSADQLEKTVNSWNLQLRVMAVVAASELDLARSIWPSPFDEAACIGVLSSVMRTLIQQGSDVAGLRKGGSSRVFVLLEMNKHLKEVLPLLEELLGHMNRFGQYLSELRNLYTLLARTARSAFSEFEMSVERDNSKAQTVDGTVHPQCAHILSFLRRLFSYPNTEVLFSTGRDAHDDDAYNEEARSTSGMSAGQSSTAADSSRKAAKVADSPVSVSSSHATQTVGAAVETVMGGLLHSMEFKSKLYKIPALGAVFLMNNVNYMVSASDKTEGKLMLSKTWLKKHRDMVEEYAQQYHALTWQPVVKALERILSGEEVQPSDHAKWREWVKAKWKAFNTAFEAIYMAQTGWTIPDARLKCSVRKAIKQDLLPAYEAFFEEYSTVEFSVNRSKYVRYSPDKVEAFIDKDLFEGQPMDFTKVRPQATSGSRPL